MEKDNLETLRHSCSHILASAVKELFPEVNLGIGPAIDTGFYYDFDKKTPFTPEDLKKIESKMHEIINKGQEFKKIKYSKEKAKKLLKNEPYKLELLKELKDKEITFYQNNDFIDLCKGPHVKNTKEIKAFNLLSIAGAYWKGNEKNKMLQRIYGTAFPSESELKNYIKILEEAEKRDHIKIGKQLELFSLHSAEVGPGLVHWHPNGSIIRNEIENFWKEEHKKRNYLYIYTPHIGNLNLWKKSGHWNFYRESMYSPMKIDEIEYLLKPMNCPFHIQIYQNKLRSYKELPLRYCELGTVYRYERAGTLHGLTRVRGFTQDDSHIFCAEEQLEKEIENVLDLALFMLKTFGFKEFKIDLSVRGKDEAKYLGTNKVWNNAESSLKKALENKKLRYNLAEGEAVFYGPKIDIKLLDALNREWQGPTIQVDFNFPEKFKLEYIGKDDKRHVPVMIHRTVLGSMERFFAVLTEHYAGKFPLWLSPVQVILLTVTDRNIGFAEEILKQLQNNNIRAELDSRAESISYKVRESQLRKIPKIITIGDKETQNKTLAIRTLDGKVKFNVKIEEFIKEVIEAIKNKC